MQLHSLCNFVYIINSYILVSVDFIHIFTYIHIYICNRCIPKKMLRIFFTSKSEAKPSRRNHRRWALLSLTGGTLSFQFDHMIGRLNDSPGIRRFLDFFLKKMECRFISNSSYPRSGVIFLCFPKYQVFSWVFFPSKKTMESSSGNYSLLCPEASPETQKAMMALMMKTSLSFQFGQRVTPSLKTNEFVP